MQGRFIAIEGLDGSGGTTQVQRLVAALPAAHATREPSDGPVGRFLRGLLDRPDRLPDSVLPYLFAADRQDHLDREIRPLLEAGRTVVTDRYLASSLAYQAAAAPLDHLLALNARFPLPDLTLYLDLPPAVCMERVTRRGGTRERFESLERLEAIAAAYGVALAALAERGARVVPIDARGSVEEVHGRVLRAVEALAP